MVQRDGGRDQPCRLSFLGGSSLPWVDRVVAHWSGCLEHGNAQCSNGALRLHSIQEIELGAGDERIGFHVDYDSRFCGVGDGGRIRRCSCNSFSREEIPTQAK